MSNGDDCDDVIDDPVLAHQGEVCLPAGVQQGGGDGADVAIGGHVEHFLLKYIKCLNILLAWFSDLIMYRGIWCVSVNLFWVKYLV